MDYAREWCRQKFFSLLFDLGTLMVRLGSRISIYANRKYPAWKRT